MKKQTVVLDLEAMQAMQPWPMQPWQQKLLGGIPAGALNVISVGRQTGKSMVSMQVLKNRYYGTNLCKEILMPIKPASKYKFSRAKWYTAQINPDGMWRLSREYNEIIAWCTEQFGKHPSRQDAWSRWWVGIGEIYFRDETDYILYQLKWA